MSTYSFPNTALLDKLRHWVLISDINFKLCYANVSASEALEIDSNSFEAYGLDKKIVIIEEGSPAEDVKTLLLRHNHEEWQFKASLIEIENNKFWLIEQAGQDLSRQEKVMSKNLRESEARFRAVIEQSDEGLILFDEEGKITLWNKGEEIITGYDANEMIGQYIWDAMYLLSTDESKNKSAQSAATIRKRIINLLQRKDISWTQEFKSRIYTKQNGQERIIQTTLFPVVLEGNYMFGSINRDITSQHQSATKLRETTTRLKAVINAMPDLMYIIDSSGIMSDSFQQEKQSLTAIDFNKGKHINSFFDSHTSSKILLALKRAQSSKQTQVFDLMISKPNQKRTYEARISPMNSNSGLLMLREITNIRQLENNLLLNNRLLQILTHLATRFINLPVSQTDEAINNALKQIGLFAEVDRVYIFDYVWEEAYMTNTYEWCSEGTTPEIENLKRVSNQLVPDWVNSHIKGEITIVERIDQLDSKSELYKLLEPQNIKSLITIPLMEDHKCLGYVGFDAVKQYKSFTDNELALLQIFAELLTNLKIKQRTEQLLKSNHQILENQNQQLSSLNEKLKHQNEEILEKNAALAHEREKAEASDRLKTAFLNNISHEIRTPLNGIVGFSQLLSDPDLSLDDRIDFIEALGTSVERLTDTFNDIMDVSLLMSGNMPYNVETIHLASLLNDIYKKHLHFSKIKGIELKMEIAEPWLKTNMDTDRGYLYKIFNELVTNAIKYTDGGFIHMGFEIQDEELILFVRDSGKGISPEALPEIYKPFIQEDFSSTRNQEGAGLGLTIVKGLVHLLKGRIKIDSVLGQGTTFFIHLPLKSAINMEIFKTVEKPLQAETNQEWPTLLVAEDEDLNILYTKRIFKSKPFNVLYARNGSEAVEIVKANHNIDLVLMDIKMPVMDGLEATKQIKMLNPDLRVIAVTAYAANDDRFMCLNAGCDDYITKPFKPAELFEMIQNWLSI
ncbi:MAG: response regulator [Bacteroidales bacterium]|jgi:PAS domain S-box-containing protein|nr:response regulator [Bacteroidales bacterium]